MPATLSTRAESMPGGPATGKRDSAAGGRPLGREDGAGVRSRPLAAGHELLAADEDVLDAIGARDVAGRAARKSRAFSGARAATRAGSKQTTSATHPGARSPRSGMP